MKLLRFLLAGSVVVCATSYAVHSRTVIEASEAALPNNPDAVVYREPDSEALLEKINTLQSDVNEAMGNTALSMAETFLNQVDNVSSELDAYVEIVATNQSLLDELQAAVNSSLSIVESISNELDIVNDYTETLNVKEDELIVAGACSPIPLYSVGSSTIVISSPGTYRLAQDIILSSGSAIPAISITTSNVTLDLNGFEIFSSVNGSEGIRIINAAPISSIVIKNGSIRTTATNGTGIDIDSVTDLTIRDVRISGWQFRGAFISNSRLVQLDNVIVSGAITTQGILLLAVQNAFMEGVIARANRTGYLIQACSGVVLRNVAAYSNTLDGFNFTSSASLRLQQCISNLNARIGFVISSSSNAVFTECLAVSNGPTAGAAGFVLSGTSNNMVFQRCIAESSTGAGFTIQNSSIRLLFKECRALKNSTNGFDIGFTSSTPSMGALSFIGCEAIENSSSGFTVGTNTSGNIIKGCRSIGNGTIGFNANNPGNRFYANFSYKNTSANYSGVVNAAAVTATAATYWPANVTG